LDRAFRDAHAELQELASNPFGSPEPVLGRHAVDEGDELRRETRLAWTARAGFPTPEESESFPVPSQHRLGPDQQQGLAPAAMEAREEHEEASLVDAKGRALHGPRGDDELLPKERVLGDQLGARAGQIGDESARDARRPARVPERHHRAGRQARERRRKPGARDAEHRAIRADPEAIIKGCSREKPGRSCGGGGK
jgi:hypothetical protein